MCAAILDSQHAPGRGGRAKASERGRRGGRRRVGRGRRRGWRPRLRGPPAARGTRSRRWHLSPARDGPAFHGRPPRVAAGRVGFEVGECFAARVFMEDHRLIDAVLVALAVGIAGALIFLAAEKQLRRLADTNAGKFWLVAIASVLLVVAAALITGKAVDFIIPLPNPRFEESGAPLWRAILNATALSSLIVVLPFLQTFYSESRATQPSVWSLKAERLFWGEVASLNVVAHVAKYGVLGIPTSAAFSIGNTLLFVSASVGFTSSHSTSKEHGRAAIRWICVAAAWTGATLQSF